ncbi:MAG: thioesterase family protein [Desulfitobacterium hafniense]|nr:thioesterase family protein [Desulfitobacterium hafniense]
MSLTSTTTLRVRYAETDQMGVVYHSNYLVWFEVGRSELFRDLGLPYTLFEEAGLILAVVEANCRYKQPAHYDDEVAVITTLSKFSSRMVTFTYEVYREDTLLVVGNTSHVFINKHGRPTDAKGFPIWSKVTEIVTPKLKN